MMVGAMTGRTSGYKRLIRSGTLAIGVLLVAAAAALATVHFRSGALYTGKSSACGSSVPGTTCVFKFRAAIGGMSLKFAGKTVIDTWDCGNGGGEALLGGKAQGVTPIPVIKLHADGTLHGSVAYVLTPTGAPPQHYTSWVTGHLSRAGKAAKVTFHIKFKGDRSPCSTQPVLLTERGSSVGGSH
jgi:hypothetical protein